MDIINENVKLELTNHTNKIKFANENVNNQIREYLSKINNELQNYILLEKNNHIKRLISISNNMTIEPQNNIDFIEYNP
jgi:hypothetical protein